MSGLEEIIQRGAGNATGFTFDFGDFNDPKYGKANMRGFLEIPLKQGEYRFPNLVTQPELLNEIAIEVLPLVRDVLSNCLDDDILKIIKEYALIMALAQPKELTPKGIKIFMLSATFGAGADDVEDSSEDQLFTCKALNEMINGFTSMFDDAFWDKIPGITPQMQAVKDVGRQAAKYAEEEFGKDFGAKFWASGLKDALFNGYQAILSSKEIKNSGHEFSRRKKFESFREISLMQIAPEMLCVLYNVNIPQDIRTSYLFKSVLNAFLDISAMLNAILGIPKDLKRNEDSHVTYLLNVEKLSLQEAFDIVYNEMLAAYTEYLISCKKLIEVYSDNENVHQYVYYLNYIHTGSLFGYKVINRYGSNDTMKAKFYE